MTRRTSLVPSALTPLCALGFLFLASQAHADEVAGPERVPARPGDFSLKIEPGVAVPLSRPQSERFDVGGGQTVQGLWAISPYWDIGPSVTFLALPAADSVSEAGTAWAFGPSVRFKRPHHVAGEGFSAASSWVNVGALYVRTAELNRPGVSIALGVAVPTGKERNFWLGPFVRYFQIIQGTPSGFENSDARILSIGISLEVGTGVKRQMHRVAAAEKTVVATADCPDRDSDGLPDSVDRCPDVAGPIDSFGCRPYQKLVVQKDKLELKEKLYFAWDQATIQEESYPALDEVVQALNDNKNFRVQVEGHSSSDGADNHNKTLSEKRADAVVAYLVAHGIAKERLASKGFASSVPIDTNATVAGRENNRRVEFVVYFTILEGAGK